MTILARLARSVGLAVVVLAMFVVLLTLVGATIEMRLAPEGGLEPIPTWWLSSQPPPPGLDCGEDEAGSCAVEPGP